VIKDRRTVYQYVLSDFGLSRLLNNTQLASVYSVSDTRGTPIYWAPEVVKADDLLDTGALALENLKLPGQENR